MKKERDILFDYIRGIGISLVVLGHTNPKFRNYIYLFHMAIFFIVSGYFFDEKIELKKLLRKRIRSLYVPCVLINMCFVFLNNFFIKIHIYSDIEFGDILATPRFEMSSFIKEVLQCFAFGGGSALSGYAWFFRTMFIATFMFYFICRISDFFDGHLKGGVRVLLSISCLLIGYMASVRGLNNKIFNCFSVVILFLMGQIFRNMKAKFEISNMKCIISIVSNALILYILNSIVSIEIMANNISNPLYFIVVSMSGWFMLYHFSLLLKRINKKNILLECLSSFGSNSITILVWHILSFKVVTLIQLIYYNYDIKYLAKYPVFINTPFWIIMYCTVGVGIPMVVVFLKSAIIKKWVLLKTQQVAEC